MIAPLFLSKQGFEPAVQKQVKGCFVQKELQVAAQALKVLIRFLKDYSQKSGHGSSWLKR